MGRPGRRGFRAVALGRLLVRPAGGGGGLPGVAMGLPLGALPALEHSSPASIVLAQDHFYSDF